MWAIWALSEVVKSAVAMQNEPMILCKQIGIVCANKLYLQKQSGQDLTQGQNLLTPAAGIRIVSILPTIKHTSILTSLLAQSMTDAQ